MINNISSILTRHFSLVDKLLQVQYTRRKEILYKMKGIASGTLLLVGHVTLALTSSYVLTLLNQRGLLNLGMRHIGVLYDTMI